jgi:O-antigen/teichoic acid export membrane protein
VVRSLRRRPAPRQADLSRDAGDRQLGDGLALSLCSMLGSVAGLLGWLITARIMSPEQAGDAQLVVSAFMLVGGAAQLNLDVGVMRWLPSAGSRTSRLLWIATSVITTLALALSLGYALLTPRLTAVSGGTEGFSGLGLLLFVLVAVGWGVFTLHDFALVALGRPWWAVWRNGVFAAVRLGLLVVWGGVFGLGAQGIVLSWVAPVVLWIVAGSLVIAVLARKISTAAPGGSLPRARAAVAYLAPVGVAEFGGLLLYNQVPVVVNLRFGPTVGIVFFIAWQAVTVIDIASVFFMNSVAVGVARAPDQVAELAASARRRLLVVFLPFLAVGALLAHPALSIFGDAYAEGDHILQLLLVGLAFRLLVLHELGMRQALGAGMAYARLQLGSTILVLIVAITVPVAGDDVSALLPLAIGYIVVQVISAAAVLIFPRIRMPWRRHDVVRSTSA